MIQGELTGAKALTTWADERPMRLREQLGRAIGRLVLTLVRKVKQEKLSGQVLNVRTGRLRRSINPRMEGIGTDTPAGYVGTNVKYARPHEYGFKGETPVKAHLRTIKQAWGRAIEAKQVQVAGHSRKMDLPERSFLRSALEEMGPQIHAELRNAATEALK